jgi:Anti-sigma-28 factor, FlgM
MGDLDELAEAIRRGEYKVDPHAVADAMLRSMLEAGKPLDRPAVGVEQDEPAAGPDLA